MELYTVSPLTLTLLGSTLDEFEALHTEYSGFNTLEGISGVRTTLYENVGFKPFLVVIYNSEGEVWECMTLPSVYKGTYHLLPMGGGEIGKPRRVVIHLRTAEQYWSEVRVVIQDSRKDIPWVWDLTAPSNVGIRDGFIDVCDGLYKPDVYKGFKSR